MSSRTLVQAGFIFNWRNERVLIFLGVVWTFPGPQAPPWQPPPLCFLQRWGWAGRKGFLPGEVGWRGARLPDVPISSLTKHVRWDGSNFAKVHSILDFLTPSPHSAKQQEGSHLERCSSQMPQSHCIKDALSNVNN